MEDEEKIFKIKRDLRQLRKITHSIEVSIQVKEKHEKRLLLLSERKQTNEIKSEIAKIKRVLESLHIENYIKTATEIESKYMEAINKLDPLDKTIILEGYINGTAYWKIGRNIGYSEIGIQKRVSKIIEKLSTLI